ncbi:Hypothetical predicted protein [Cloeon dipterum]|uniref:Vitellogenin domain-containing protein n=1 Tax=Cloeon dipterum TaxID=197152 RepID=A0A8S1DWG9_9INSE|nr:Hypothetical predicted protein [Cloeon dipterum]
MMLTSSSLLQTLLIVVLTKEAFTQLGSTVDADLTKYNYVVKVYPITSTKEETTPAFFISPRYALTINYQLSINASLNLVKTHDGRVFAPGRITYIDGEILLVKMCESGITQHFMSMETADHFDFTTNSATAELIFYEGDVLKSKTAEAYSNDVCNANTDLIDYHDPLEDYEACSSYDSSPTGCKFIADDANTYLRIPALAVNGIVVAIIDHTHCDGEFFSTLPTYRKIIYYRNLILSAIP